ncbi:1-acyl-sn-glycerol-3-phosphate acyltransferase [Pedobacter sp. SD-b]|uniref:1-acyl-sn-glycerol-3-phosphate acyltransferase n=1 Tax=Pedobacter segetis TaxID=2793069 RepID=A0ABS1BIJ1_9SPHI|nr:1-acyl-sn-glycerol-3-phosphate acyltransferase [Pedobacter segetis]MBK0382658.1 1-acyl-sn-glycerol-3-phosphate acyltransferase [Pedobacter segetis]
MTYFFFYHLLKITCKLYFKKIKVYDYENVSPSKPLIICANHGNSFMDAILMAVIFKRKLHFLARADAFNTPFKKWFLGKINMMPVYRIRDGREVLKNNDAIFDKCQSILENNGAILIFPEGNCVVEKRLRTFKAGFLQMAFACKKTDLQVLPVTINYSKPLEFYSQVSLKFQKPIAIQIIKEQTQNDYISFSKVLLSKTIEGISNDMLIIPEGEDRFYEQALEINLTDLKVGFVSSQLKLIERLNEIKEQDIERFNELKIKTAFYFAQINALKISDEMMVMYNKTNKFFVFLSIPFYYLGEAIHYLPTTLISGLIDKKIKQLQFKGAVRMIFGMFVYIIYVPIILFITYCFFGLKWMALMIIIFYITRSDYKKLSFQGFLVSKKMPELIKLRTEIKVLINLL